jgi:hypothetical protein
MKLSTLLNMSQDQKKQYMQGLAQRNAADYYKKYSL